ncbi:MAG TPA: hypothetical protein VHE12_03650 [bacterium]|nr:hypothetical protein [bacterium]
MALVFLAFSVLGAGEPVKTPVDPAGKFLPDLVLCGKKHDGLIHVRKEKVDWDWALDGPVLDVQPQPAYETYLVTGGSGKVSLVRKVWKGCKVLWDWSALSGVSVVSAVVADWDEKDKPTLVLGADASGPRLFLADARAHETKVRWSYKLPAAPLRVHLCTDNGNFLVTLGDGTVQELHFQEDKVVMTLGQGDGLQKPLDAVRDPWANTYVADAGRGDVLCFDPKRKVLWTVHLPFAPGKPEAMALSLYRKMEKRMLMASVHFSGGNSETAQDVIYVINTATGGVLAWSDKTEKGGYPSFTKAVPDRAEYLKKQ